MFARKIRCFENFCSLCSLPAQEKSTLLAKGAAGGGGGRRLGTGLAPVEDSEGSKAGGRLWFPGSPFWQLQRLWMPPPPCPLRPGLRAVCSAERGRLAICHGLVGVGALGPQNRMPRGSRASRSSSGPGEGLPDDLAETQWSRLAPMQAA